MNAPGAASRAAARAPAPKPVTLGMRVTARALRVVGWLACRLPEGPLWRAARFAGRINYRISRERRDMARRNLRQVVEWMAANGVGEERYRRAARDRRALERLVEEAFRQHACYYLEMMRSPLYDRKYLDERLLIETPEEVAEAFASRRALILLGMHFGAIELPALLCAVRLGTVTAPMETVGNPLIQRWLVETRGTSGVHIVDLEHAATEIASALSRNEPVGFVADRDINASGEPVPFFGGTARFPRGPALLAVESAAPVYVGSVRRAGIARYRGHMATMPLPAEGSRRQRMRAFLEAEARMYEETVALAPEQWWAVFYPIFEDKGVTAA